MAKLTAIQPNAFIYSCLENITRLIPGSMGAFYLVNDRLEPQQHILSGISEETHQAYLREFLLLDPLHPQHFNALAVSFASLDNVFRSTPYYHQFMQPHGMNDMVEVYIRRERKIVAGLSLMRSYPFSLQEHLRLRAILPLIEVATDELLPAAENRYLTPKEQIIVDMVREGACNKRIASQLDISLSTVKTHLRNIFSKTHASNRTELLRNVNASWYLGRVSAL